MKLARVELSTWKYYFEDLEHTPFWIQIFNLRRANVKQSPGGRPEASQGTKEDRPGLFQTYRERGGQEDTRTTPGNRKVPRSKAGKRVREEK